MSILLSLCQVSSSYLDELAAHPGLAEVFLEEVEAKAAAVSDSEYASASKPPMPRKGTTSFLQWIGLVRRDSTPTHVDPLTPEQIEVLSDELRRRLDWMLQIDKSWHIIHYLLTRSAWGGAMPGAALLNATAIGPVDWGYNRPRVLTVFETKAFADFLKKEDFNELTASLDYDQLKRDGVHDAHILEPSPGFTAPNWENVRDDFERLRIFMSNSANADMAVIIWLGFSD